jgi:four helix bundle protein
VSETAATPPYRFRKLYAWQRAMELAVEADALADRLSALGRFALADQMRRAATSVPANIAEGNGRAHRGEYLRFLGIAKASLAELETLLELAQRRRLLPEDSLAVAFDLASQTGRLLLRLIQSLRIPAKC